MRKMNLKVGILLMIAGIIIGAVCLLLPTLANNRVNFKEAAFGFIPAGVFFTLGFVFAVLALIFIHGAKKVSANYQSQLAPEGIVFFEEDLKGSTTFRDLRRPGMYHKWKKTAIAALLVLTGKRLLALKGSSPLIDLPLTDARLRQMRFSMEGEKTLLIAFDANLFQPDWSGAIEYRFKTAKAKEFLRKINEMMK